MLDIQQSPFYDEVEWFDTDASEDEDYLPPLTNTQDASKNFFLKTVPASSFDSHQEEEEEEESDFLDRKRNRMNSISSDINTRDVFRRKLTISPLDKVRKAIDKTIDEGIERVDISHVELTEIPDEIEELQYVTVVHHDIVKTASLQIFLYGNYIQSINLRLFRLKNLSVLSLRNNRLTTIPPEIALLENLVELSLGNNQLKTIPAELLRLKKLQLLYLLPNPFLPLPTDNSHRHRLKHINPPTLREIVTRSLLSQSNPSITNYYSVLPTDLVQTFQSISPINHCEHCKLLFHIPNLEEIVWKNVLGNHHIPVLYRFCSIRCSEAFVS